MENNELIKYEGGLIKRVGNAISVTNKLLAAIEPKLIPYRKKDKWGFCTPDKKIVIDCVYDKANQFSDGLAEIKINNEHAFINVKEETIINLDSEEKRLYGIFNEGICSVKAGEEIGFIDKTGKTIVPCIYDDAYYVNEGLWAVSLKMEYGFIDKTGRVIIPFQYEYPSCFFNGIAKVLNPKNWNELFINKKGEEVILPKEFDESLFKNDFNNGLARIKMNRKIGYCDENGVEVIPCIYDDGSIFIKGIAAVYFQGTKGYINKEGVQYWED